MTLRRFPSLLCRRGLATLRERAKFKVEDGRYLYEPKIADPHKYPLHKQMHVRLQGYDYVPLEKFQSYVHKCAENFGFKVTDSYAAAAKTEQVQTFRSGTSVAESVLNLSIYDRWVVLDDVLSVRLPLFVAQLQANAPSGVKVTLKTHTKEDDNYRYIPDLLLIEKQQELKSLDDPEVRKLLGWE